MLIAFIALLIAAAAMLALPQALKNVIDKGFRAANAAAIDRYFLLLLLAAAVFAAFASLRMYLVNWIGERVVADLRSAVYHRVIRMDPAFFEVTKTGEVLSRLTTDTTLIQSLSGIGLSILLRSTVSFLGSLVLLLLTSLKLALIIFALIPTVLAAHAAVRAARAPAVARFAGSRGRHLGPGRRDAERHPDRAGLHARGAARPALRRRGGGEFFAPPCAARACAPG